MIADNQGNVQKQYDYAPYGELHWQSGTDPNHYQFAGKELDTESGDSYFGARYYRSSFGRFLTPDWAATPEPVPYATVSLPQTLNLYSYVGNNPTTGIDPDGHCLEDACVVELAVGAYSLFTFTASPAGQQMIHDGLDAAAHMASALVNSIHHENSSAPKPDRVVHEVDPKTAPEAAQHVKEAQDKGHPKVVHVGPAGSNVKNRKEALKGVPTVPNKHRDEYPPAWSKEGGEGADVKHIDPHDNTSDGAAQGNTIRGLPEGTEVEIRVKVDPESSPNANSATGDAPPPPPDPK